MKKLLSSLCLLLSSGLLAQQAPASPAQSPASAPRSEESDCKQTTQKPEKPKLEPRGLVSGREKPFPALDLIYCLPSENQALFTGTPEEFYTYVDRYFEGDYTRPWQGGTYGMTRTPFRNSEGEIMYSKFHEGIDINPMRRDEAGEPLDPITTIAPGVVAYVNNSATASNYGRYLVIAHHVPEGIIYSLYAHMKSISARQGDVVIPGVIIGEMGYTGRGLDRRRAHLHLEVALMINSRYFKYAPGVHDRFNGLNLIGMNVTDLLMASRGGKAVSISKYFSTLKEHYRIRVPYQEKFDLIDRYPFLYKAVRGKEEHPPLSYDISFTAEGLPIAIWPCLEEVDDITVVKATPAPTYQQNITANRLKNSSKNAALTATGKRYINLYLFPFKGMKRKTKPTPPTPPTPPAPQPVPPVTPSAPAPTASPESPPAAPV